MYVKDKNKNEVEKNNNSVVNRLEKIIKNKRINFNLSCIGEFNYKMLDTLHTKDLNKDIIKLYEELDMKKFTMMNSKKDVDNFTYVYQNIKEQILNLNPDIYYVVSVLVEYLYNIKKTKNKTTLWECFGDIIVENIKYNITEKYIQCKGCGVLEEKISNNHKYCSKCHKRREKEKKKKWWKNHNTRPFEKI